VPGWSNSSGLRGLVVVASRPRPSGRWSGARSTGPGTSSPSGRVARPQHVFLEYPVSATGTRGRGVAHNRVSFAGDHGAPDAVSQAALRQRTASLWLLPRPILRLQQAGPALTHIRTWVSARGRGRRLDARSPRGPKLRATSRPQPHGLLAADEPSTVDYTEGILHVGAVVVVGVVLAAGSWLPVRPHRMAVRP
jgi:hypothetical protein